MVENNKNDKNKIAIIGSPDSVLGWRALGLTTFGVHKLDQAQEALNEIDKGGFAIVFITEDWYGKLEEDLIKFKERALPAIISVPSQHGSTGAGLENLRRIVERAVGSDILFNK
jgi:V/A-type H+-transporting ATPase subunit F